MFRALIRKEIEKIVPKGAVFSVERQENPEHGDYSSNAALVLAKKDGKNPKEVAAEIKKALGNLVSKWVDKIEIAGPGFLNFWISRGALIENLSIFLRKGERFSKREGVGAHRLRWVKTERNGKRETSKKINIEFVSANPTGPLTMANGRGGFYGDALANILEAIGHEVTREYYINDTGNQIKLLGESILAAAGKIEQKDENYKGAYVKKLKGKTAKQAAAILLGEIKKSLKKAGIKFDVWFSEDKNLRKTGELEKVLKFLNSKKLIKEKEGALWLRDAVVIKSNKEPTYFLADLAYHYDKFIKRKFDLAINVWGADHHGYVERMKKGIEALGVSPDRLKIIIMQLVRLTSGGKEVKMSKRAGEFVTLDNLLKKVGVDAARWFFLERSPDSHMDFDFDLAKERSKKNPVYYVQYATARCNSILRKSEARSAKSERGKGGEVNLQLLSKPEELSLIKKILQLPEIIEDIANDYQIHRLPRYAYELAKTFTDFYEKHRVVDSKNPDLTATRLLLVSATQKTIKITLSLMGIDTPSRM